MPMTEAERATSALSPCRIPASPIASGADHPARGHNAIDIEPTLGAEHHAFGHRPHLQTQISEAVDEHDRRNGEPSPDCRDDVRRREPARTDRGERGQSGGNTHHPAAEDDDHDPVEDGGYSDGQHEADKGRLAHDASDREPENGKPERDGARHAQRDSDRKGQAVLDRERHQITDEDRDLAACDVEDAARAIDEHDPHSEQSVDAPARDNGQNECRHHTSP